MHDDFVCGLSESNLYLNLKLLKLRIQHCYLRYVHDVEAMKS